MTPKFTDVYTTFDEWLAAHPQATPYQRRIVRLHKKHPEATLTQLRGHPKTGEPPICWIKLRAASPEALAEFSRLAKRYVEFAGCVETDSEGRRIIWKRPMDEPQ